MGGMAEWTKGGGLENRCGVSHRGFESYSHRPLWRGAGVVETGLPAKQLWRKPSWVRIPPSPFVKQHIV